MNKRVLIIIPCYNEAENIPGLFAELKAMQIPGYSLTPLFINDASTDTTREILEQHKALHLSNPVNLGIGGTVQLGFIYACRKHFDIAVQLDGDGQHPPAELPGLLNALGEHADVVIGSRFLQDEGFRSTFARRMGIGFFYRLNKLLMGIAVKDSTSGYRAYNRRAFTELAAYYPDEYPEPEAITWLASKKMRILEVPVSMQERAGGVSSIRRFHTLYYMAKVSSNILFLYLKIKLRRK